MAEALGGDLERTGLRAWPEDLDELPRISARTPAAGTPCGIPGLRGYRKATVDIKVFANPADQAAAMASVLAGLLRLDRAVPGQGDRTRTRAPGPAWRSTPIPTASWRALLDDCADAPLMCWFPNRCGRRSSSPASWPRPAGTRAHHASRGESVEKVLAAAHEVQVAPARQAVTRPGRCGRRYPVATGPPVAQGVLSQRPASRD